MALADTETMPAQRIQDNPVLRQLGVMVGIAASVALGVAVVLWSQTPNYSVLFANLAAKDVTEVIDALQKNNIDFKVDQATGAVMVSSNEIQNARLKLAGEGLPRSDSFGFELLQQESGFGTSRLVEEARYQRAMEGELSRTIASLANVETARVHIASPKQSVFVRKRKHPSASVVVKLFAGRSLEKGQVDAIVHLVASSVPELDPSKVTLVDHKGRLLNGQNDSRLMSLTSTQFEYTRNLEQHYKERIEDLLRPILGGDNIRAEVTADIDFTVTEQTHERFNPDQPALRSEQINERVSQLDVTQGVPGALSNQPPAAGQAPEVAGAGAGANQEPINSSKQATRNYEVDRTLSHTQLESGVLRRLSVAVVVNDRVTADEDGAITNTPRTQEEIERISSLVKDAIGYTLERGDSVRIINSAFHVPAPPEPLPELAMWEEPWFWDVVRQAGGVILVLVLVFVVILPTMKKLMTPIVVKHELPEGMPETGEAPAAPGQPALAAAGEPMSLAGPREYEQTLEAAKGMIQEDPKRVAQVVKKWIAEDAG